MSTSWADLCEEEQKEEKKTEEVKVKGKEEEEVKKEEAKKDQVNDTTSPPEPSSAPISEGESTAEPSKDAPQAAPQVAPQAAPQAAPTTNIFDKMAEKRQVVNEGRVELKHSDPNFEAPPGVESFEELGLKPELLRLLATTGFESPSPIQKHVLPITLTGRNIVAQAPSGTGKTMTFTITILQNIDVQNKWPQAVIVSPTMELAQGIFGAVDPLAKAVGFETELVIREMKNVNRSAQLIVGTPGKLASVFGDRRAKLYINPTKISVFVLDEADKMLAQDGLLSETLKVKNHCKNIQQFVLTSATFSDQLEDYALKRFLPSTWSMAKIVAQGSELKAIPKKIKHYLLLVKDASLRGKIAALENLIKVFPRMNQTFIFTQKGETANSVGELMAEMKKSYVVLSGQMSAAERKRCFGEFESLKKKICVCTSGLGARGLDIPNCTTVINFDVPEDAVTYVHRAGRSGRMGNSGYSFTLVTSPQERDTMKKIFGECVQTDGKPIVDDEYHLTSEEDLFQLEEELAKLDI